MSIILFFKNLLAKNKKILIILITILFIGLIGTSSQFVLNIFGIKKEKAVEFNETFKNAPKITYRNGRVKAEKILSGECPVISKKQYYIYIEFTINDEVWQNNGLVYVTLIKKVPKNFFGTTNENTKNLTVDNDGLVTLVLFTEYFKTKKGVQRLKVNNQISDGKYVIEYGYFFNISGSSAHFGQKSCNYDL